MLNNAVTPGPFTPPYVLAAVKIQMTFEYVTLSESVVSMRDPILITLLPLRCLNVPEIPLPQLNIQRCAMLPRTLRFYTTGCCGNSNRIK